MTTAGKALIAAMCWSNCLWAQQPAPAERQDWLYMGGDGRKIGQASGAGASLLWLSQREGRDAFTFGVSTNRVGAARWTTATAGQTVFLGDRTFLEGAAEVGAGNFDGGPLRFRVQATRKVTRRFALTVGDEYLRFGRASGSLLKGGAMVQTSRRTSVEASYSASVSGNLNTNWAAGAVSLSTKRATVKVGSVYGRTRSEVLGVGLEAAHSNLQQHYAALTIPAGRSQWILGLDAIHFASLWRPGLSLTLRVPLFK